jgi:hypothetical protein
LYGVDSDQPGDRLDQGHDKTVQQPFAGLLFFGPQISQVFLHAGPGNFPKLPANKKSCRKQQDENDNLVKQR